MAGIAGISGFVHTLCFAGDIQIIKDIRDIFF